MSYLNTIIQYTIILYTTIFLSLSISLSLYIYIYIYIHTFGRRGPIPDNPLITVGPSATRQVLFTVRGYYALLYYTITLLYSTLLYSTLLYYITMIYYTMLYYTSRPARPPLHPLRRFRRWVPERIRRRGRSGPPLRAAGLARICYL